MKTKSLLSIIALMIFLNIAIGSSIRGVKAEGVDLDTIHPMQYNYVDPDTGKLVSRTSPPGEKIGCLTSGIPHIFYVDFYSTKENEKITSLALQSGDGTNEESYSTVGFSVTWEYFDGASWISYSGAGDIPVPYSGEGNVGNLQLTDPHLTVRVTFPVSGSLGQLFYFRIHFTGVPNSGNHYFYYDICNVPSGVPEFPVDLPVVTSIGFTVVYAVRKKRTAKTH